VNAVRTYVRRWLFADAHWKLNEIMKEVWHMGAAIDLLKGEVAELTTVVESAIALIQGFADRIKDAATLEEVQAVVAEIEAEKQSLADAVTANTV
jgi:hypothetical protein